MMKHLAKTAAALTFTVAAITGCSQEEPPVVITADPVTERELESGTVVGFVEANGAHVWRALPYAADTSGENRWRAPQPVSAWERTREAITFGPACAQIATPFTQLDGWVDGTLQGSEDCLTVDVYAPPGEAAGRPVMVWIHGGSNVSGASQLYQGHRLAVNEDVIVVSVQYRLGPLGFFALPDCDENDPCAANFALLDLIAALDWVKRHAEVFGGDPENVTIFGESAGGHNVAGLLVSPLAEGLYDRAILQSGLMDSFAVPDAKGATGEALNNSGDVIDRLGGADRLRTATVDEVFAAYQLRDGMWLELPRMIADGVTIPNTSLKEAMGQSGPSQSVPVITGTNKDEMKLFLAFDDTLVKTTLGVFRSARDQDFYDAASEYSARMWRLNAVHGVADSLIAAGNTKVYAYQFDWDEGGSFLFTDFAELFGAAHAFEIPFVFNRFQLLGQGDPILFTKKTEASREELSRAMGAYWASFARSDIPAAPGQAAWPSYGENSSTIIFDSTRDQGIVTRSAPDSLQSIVSDLQADPRLDADERCAMFQLLVNIEALEAPEIPASCSL